MSNFSQFFHKRRCRWAVTLECGHDTLVTNGQLYGGFGVCDCPWRTGGDPLWRRSRKIAKRWVLVPVTCRKAVR